MNRGKFAIAAFELLHWLHDKGITHGPVQQPSRHDRRLVAFGLTRGDIQKLPKSMNGFPVFGTMKPVDCYRDHGICELVRVQEPRP